MAWALRARAPAASLITTSRSALRAEGAARLWIGRGSRWLPSPTRATRSAPRAWALRARLPAAAESLPRATRSAPNAWALRARACTLALTPMHAHVASWWWGCRRRRALRAARDARCKARFALLPRARVGRGGPDIIMRERAFERLCAAAACAVRVGAERRWDRSAFSPGQADPPRFQRACSSASRWSGADPPEETKPATRNNSACLTTKATNNLRPSDTPESPSR